MSLSPHLYSLAVVIAFCRSLAACFFAFFGYVEYFRCLFCLLLILYTPLLVYFVMSFCFMSCLYLCRGGNTYSYVDPQKR